MVEGSGSPGHFHFCDQQLGSACKQMLPEGMFWIPFITRCSSTLTLSIEKQYPTYTTLAGETRKQLEREVVFTIHNYISRVGKEKGKSIVMRVA